MDSLVAAAYEIPSTRSPAILQFNRVTGQFVNAIRTPDNDPSVLGGQEYFIFVVADISLTDDQVIGEYPDYKIVANKDLPTRVFESEMRLQLQTKITRRYPVITQVNVISDSILALAEKAGIELPELAEMRDYINEVKRAHEVRMKFFEESPDYEFVSIAQEEARSEAQLEGGVHELFGPKEATGGRIFS